MKRFILALMVVLLLATVLAPAAFAAANTNTAAGTLARADVICPYRICPDRLGNSCSCGRLPPPTLA